MAEHNPSSQLDRLSRHGLVMAIWAPAVFAAAVLFHAGYTYVTNWWFVAAFGSLIIAFCAHVIVNVVLKTGFTAGETALGSAVLVGLTLAYLITILTALRLRDKARPPPSWKANCCVCGMPNRAGRYDYLFPPEAPPLAFPAVLAQGKQDPFYEWCVRLEEAYEARPFRMFILDVSRPDACVVAHKTGLAPFNMGAKFAELRAFLCLWRSRARSGAGRSA